MSDPFAGQQRGLTAPAQNHFAITPSDSIDLPLVPRVLHCITGGTAVLRDAAGVTLSYSLVAGQILPFSPRRVLATGTTATLYGWW